MILLCIVVTVMTHVMPVQSMFAQKGYNYGGVPDPFVDPLFWEYYFMFTNSGPYAKTMITPGSGNSFHSRNTPPTTYSRSPNSIGFRGRAKATRNNIDTSGYNFPVNGRTYLGNSNQKDIVKNTVGYRVPNPVEMGRLRPSPAGNVSPALQTADNLVDKQNSFAKLLNTLTLKGGLGGIARNPVGLSNLVGEVVESQSALSETLTSPTKSAGLWQHPVSARNPVEGEFRSDLARNPSRLINFAGEEGGQSSDLSKSLATSDTGAGSLQHPILTGKPVPFSYLDGGMGGSQTDLSKTFIPPYRGNEGSVKHPVLSQQPRPRLDQNSDMLKTLILSGSLKVTDPLTLHYLLKEANPQGPSANIVPLLAIAGGGENTNPLLLNHILSSYSTQSTENKNLNTTDQTVNKINDFLVPLLLSHGGGGNMNPLLLQSILSQPNQYQSTPNLLHTLALTSGGESPLMQNPALMYHMMQSINQPKGGYSIQNVLPFILAAGNEQ